MNDPIPKGTLVRTRTTNGGDGFYTLDRDYVPTYPVWLTPSYGGTFVVMPCRLKSIEIATEDKPGYHCDCWDEGKACCHCGENGENGDCIPTSQQSDKPCSKHLS
jgi:hypothetical protein